MRDETRAIGLSYDRESDDSAPRVVAKGRGFVAERMLELAREFGVPVRRDPDLMQLLAVADVGEEVPAEVYAAVAQLIAFLYRMNGELGGADTE